MIKLILTIIITLFFVLVVNAQTVTRLDSLMDALPIVSSEKKAGLLNEIAIEELKNNPENGLHYASKALELAEKNKNTEQQILSYISLGKGNYYLGYLDNALEYYNKAIELSSQMLENIKDSTQFKRVDIQLIDVHNLIGIVYREQRKYSEALQHHTFSLKGFEKYNDPIGIGKTTNNIAIVHRHTGNNRRALDYFFKALDIYMQCPDSQKIAGTYNNIAIAYQNLLDYSRAQEFYQKSLKIKEQINDYKGIANSLGNLGSLNYYIQNYDSAIKYHLQSIAIKEKLNDNSGIAFSCKNLATIYIEIEDPDNARKYTNRVFEISTTIKADNLLMDCYNLYSRIDSITGDYKNAYINYRIYTAKKDSMAKENESKQIADIQTKYELHKKTKQIELMNKENALKETKIRQQRVLLYVFLYGFILIIVYTVLLFRENRQKKRVNKLLVSQNKEIFEQKVEIEAQKNKIEQQQQLVEQQILITTQQRDEIIRQTKDFTDSILYARRIQRAVITQENEIASILPDYFIIYKPRDIVSGDFYWVSKIQNQAIIAVVDCTGHGVPGAFMSMLGIAYLSEIVNKIFERGIDFSAAHILGSLRKEIKKLLHQTGKKSESQDGMDMALCLLDSSKKQLQFAGAYNPLYYAKMTNADKSEIIEIRGDRMPIGISFSQRKDFTNHIINYQAGETIYMFTDGYADQFGGENFTKFFPKNIRNLLGEIYYKPMADQKQILESTLLKWKGDVIQVDDITVFGIKLS